MTFSGQGLAHAPRYYTSTVRHIGGIISLCFVAGAQKGHSLLSISPNTLIHINLSTTTTTHSYPYPFTLLRGSLLLSLDKHNIVDVIRSTVCTHYHSLLPLPLYSRHTHNIVDVICSTICPKKTRPPFPTHPHAPYT